MVGGLLVSYLAVFGAGYHLAPKEPLDAEVTNKGLITVDTTKVLAATVESLREENRLLVFSYKGTAQVRANHTDMWLFEGEQELSVPAVVNYYLNLSRLSLADVTYDKDAKLVRIRLPGITLGDIAFEPEHATTVS